MEQCIIFRTEDDPPVSIYPKSLPSHLYELLSKDDRRLITQNAMKVLNENAALAQAVLDRDEALKNPCVSVGCQLGGLLARSKCQNSACAKPVHDMCSRPFATANCLPVTARVCSEGCAQIVVSSAPNNVPSSTIPTDTHERTASTVGRTIRATFNKFISTDMALQRDPDVVMLKNPICTINRDEASFIGLSPAHPNLKSEAVSGAFGVHLHRIHMAEGENEEGVYAYAGTTMATFSDEPEEVYLLVRDSIYPTKDGEVVGEEEVDAMGVLLAVVKLKLNRKQVQVQSNEVSFRKLGDLNCACVIPATKNSIVSCWTGYIAKVSVHRI